ncbi:phosphotransferase, partial [Myxococcota bacterium]|nr:phosphotransferase [Myxococcota bacterium]
ARMHTVSARTGPSPVLPDDPRRLTATITRWLDEAWARRLVTPSERRAATRVLTRPTRAARSLADAPMRRVVHGDLRWSNARFTADGARLVDFEHAGLGDPALDLALLTWRSPLSPDVEARFLDVYTAERSPRAASRLRARYDALLPLVAIASALAALLDTPREAAPTTTPSLGVALDRLDDRA